MADRMTRVDRFGDSLDHWGRFATRTLASELFASSHPPGELIRGQVDQIQLDLIEIAAERHSVTRTAEHVANTPKRHIFWVLLQGRGAWTPEGGAPLTLHSGDIGYWTSEIAYQWELDGPLTFLTLRAPYAAVDVAPATLAPLIGHRFSASQGVARYVVPFTQQVLADPEVLTGVNGTRILRDIVSLFTSVLLGELTPDLAGARSEPAFRRVTEHITAHLDEPLDISGIAHATAMSTRYLQSLFHDRGTTATAWIREQRLEASRLALADATRSGLSIGELAAQAGFRDQAHFARVFKARYGQTPSEWRASTHQ